MKLEIETVVNDFPIYLYYCLFFFFFFGYDVIKRLSSLFLFICIVMA